MSRGGAGNLYASRMLVGADEELGKKSDDHKPGRTASWPYFWNAPMMRYRSRKRWVVLSALALSVWLFIHYMPPDILEPMHNERIGMESFGLRRPQRPQPQYEPTYARTGLLGAPTGPPPGDQRRKKENSEEMDHYYDGDIMFYQLPSSLHALSSTQGYRHMNHHILFAASSLKSASILIPLACEMMKRDNNYVNMAFLGRNDMTLDEILEINGVDRSECKVFWHDARPDYAKYSSDFRAEASTASALDHINTYMHPQAVITDDSLAEDAFLIRQLRLKSAVFEWPLIELPQGRADRMRWITRLGSSSLAAWHKADVDIVIQAPASASGSLIRLLKSLSEADYAGLTPPRLIVELPPNVDPTTQQFIQSFQWPPANPLQPIHISQLIVRHRIPGQKVSAEEASVRFLESFFPARATEAHVLLLAPNTQLSPIFYQYIKYQLLQYKYSTVGSANSETLLGISLDLPTTHLNGSAPLNPPSVRTIDTTFTERTRPASKGTKPPFLWQAPNANAALYFGDKWAELHSFLQYRLTKFHDSSPSARPRAKVISEQVPAWTEYFLEFMRARGYSMLYPASTPDMEALVTTHKELYHAPEEFTRPKPLTNPKANDEGAAAPPIPKDNGPFIVSKNPFVQAPTEEHGVSHSYQPLHVILPFDGEDPDLGSVPHLSFDGSLLTPLEEVAVAEAFAEAFRVDVGGCAADDGRGRKRKVVANDARDLFCFGDEGEEGWVVSQQERRG